MKKIVLILIILLAIISMANGKDEIKEIDNITKVLTLTKEIVDENKVDENILEEGRIKIKKSESK